MRYCSLLLVLWLAACRQAAPLVAPTPPPDDEVEQLRLENERLRRLMAVEGQVCEPSEDARRGETVEVLLADVFYESGSAELTPEGMERLDGIATRLARDYAGRTIRVEGHTDTQPIGPSLKARYPSNWELSTARATAVVRYLQEQHALPPARLEAVGYASYEPVDTNTTAEGRARNRRVRIAVLPE